MFFLEANASMLSNRVEKDIEEGQHRCGQAANSSQSHAAQSRRVAYVNGRAHWASRVA